MFTPDVSLTKLSAEEVKRLQQDLTSPRTRANKAKPKPKAPKRKPPEPSPNKSKEPTKPQPKKVNQKQGNWFANFYSNVLNTCTSHV